MSCDRRKLLARAARLGTGALVTTYGCRTSGSQSLTSEALAGQPSVAAFPANRAAIDQFCTGFTPGHITQYGYVVPGTASSDLDAQVAAWGKSQGVGPFCVLRPAPTGKVFQASQTFAIEVDGSQSGYAPATNPSVEIALGQVADNAQVELILQRDLDSSTVYREVYPTADVGGFHHACIVSTDIGTDMQLLFGMDIEEGLELDLLITDIIGKVLYFDARGLSAPGSFFEITQETPLLQTITPVYNAIHHLGQVFGPFGQNAGATSLLAGLFIDQQKLQTTNILFEAATFPELGAQAILLATKAGWIP